MKEIICCKELKKNYYSGSFFSKNKKEVIKGLNLSIKEAEVYGLLGLNGAGKTTLIRMLSGILTQDEGDLEIFGLKYSEDEKRIKENLGVVIGGDRSLYYKLTAYENLEFFGTLYNIKKQTLKLNIEKYLKFVGLDNSSGSLVETFSKGMKQRLLIAKALLIEPKLLILDEPTLGLDIQVAYEFRQLLKKLNKELKLTILITTHYLSEAEELCSKIGILKNGVIVEEGTLQELKSKNNYKNLIYVILKNKMSITIQDKIKELSTLNEVNQLDNYKYSIEVEEKNLDEVRELVMSEKNILSIEVKGITLENIVSSYF